MKKALRTLIKTGRLKNCTRNCLIKKEISRLSYNVLLGRNVQVLKEKQKCSRKQTDALQNLKIYLRSNVAHSNQQMKERDSQSSMLEF